MPKVKFRAGKSASLVKCGEYLERDGRQLAFDSLNIVERDDTGRRWYDIMDLTRAQHGTQEPSPGKKVARRWEHIIVSPDPKDDIDLERFRDFVRSWAERWFDGGEIGRYQVAILYHDDNMTRIENGQEGILHAHIVINNTELESSTRISPKLSKRVVNRMRVDLNRRALAEGWHGFAEDGGSYTMAEMAARGLNPSRGRDLAEVMDIARDDAADIPEDVLEEIGESEAGSAKPADRKPARSRGQAPKSRQREYRTQGERGQMASDGWSWKQDIRDRLDVALRVSVNEKEFRSVLSLLGVSVSRSARGEAMYTHPSGRETWRAKGSTLGAAYTEREVHQVLAGRHAERAQRARDLPGRARYMSPDERAAVVTIAAAAEPGTREGTGTMARLKAYLAYCDAHAIHGYADFPPDAQGRAWEAYAREGRVFDDPTEAGAAAERAMGELLRDSPFSVEVTGAGGAALGAVEFSDPSKSPDALERARFEREGRGEGGLSADAARPHAPESPHGGQASSSDGARTHHQR